MRYVIHGRKLKEHIWYTGVISRYRESSSKLIIYVILDEDPDVEYIKSVRINKSINSPLARVAEDLNLVDEYGCFDSEELEDTRVKATLRKGKDDTLFINKICYDDDYYDSLDEVDEEEDIEDDDGEDDDFYEQDAE